jgi:inhibitor of cysteine peptidase
MAKGGFLFLTHIIALVAAVLWSAAGAMCHPLPERSCESMLLLSEGDNGRTLDMRVGESVKITLPENATTGYRWAIAHYDELFEAVATEPHYTRQAIGAGGEVSFIFRARNTGIGEIVLKNWRQWEGEASVTRRFRIQLNVHSER